MTMAESEILLRVVSSDLPGKEGEELRLGLEPVTIGRSDECGVVLKDARISRRHARVERALRGYKVVDLGSANGVFVGDSQISGELPLTHGTRFKIGGTVFEFVAPPPPPPQPAPTAAAGDEEAATLIGARMEFIVKIATSNSGEPVGKEFKVASASIGRGDDCNIVIKDPSSSRHHARVELAGPGQFRLIDQNSANGLWIDERKVSDEIIKEGQRFRIGDTFFECRMPVAETRSTEATAVMSDLGNLMAKLAEKALENAGEAVALSGARVVLLNDPREAFYVVSGNVEIFTVTVKDGRPLGARNHFLTLKPGQGFFGISTGFSRDSGFLATGKTGTQVRRFKVDQLMTMANQSPNLAAQVARLIENWVLGMSSRLTRDIFPRPDADVRLEVDQEATLDAGKRAKSGSAVAWVNVTPGQLLYVGMSTLLPEQQGLPFPVTPQTWIESAGEAGATVPLKPQSTTAVMATPLLWKGLDLFHETLSECEFINKRLAVVDEYQRLDSKARQSEAAREAAYDAIGAVLAGQHTEPSESAGPAAKGEPIVQASRLVGRQLAIKIQAPPETRAERSFEDHLNAIASASRFRTRRVALRGNWWKRDQGPMLARVEQTGAPVALIPRGPRTYLLIDPAMNFRRVINARMAAILAPFAYVFYRPFPPGSLSVIGLLRFGSYGLATDFWTIITMGLITGALGAITPYLTGQMIDAAIPQGDRSLLLQFGLGMLLAAFATAAFKVTQSIGVVRVESRLDYTLQAALWDRLLDLPSEFFRKYGAGDLADRASGVNAIRGLISRAGVSGILGAVSSLAYVIMMLVYNVKLSLVAMGITLLLVGF
ncbi:MAG: FHA domain-containing protein, partial [Vicinamibacteria bacterium]|nr:FHA domain-containing protein [Vicinamibacteria bacterium]